MVNKNIILAICFFIPRVVLCAVDATHLTGDLVFATQASFNTASVSPSANKLLLLAVSQAQGAGVVPAPTVTGNGLTWVQVISYLSSSGTGRFTLFRAMGSSPSSGAITISFTTAQEICNWRLTEFGGVDTSGTNGSGAIVQSVSNEASSVTSLTLTLGAFAHANNATYGYMSKSGTSTITPGTGFTELSEGTLASPTITEQTQWRVDNDTSVTWSWAVLSTTAIGLAAEIKAQPAPVRHRVRHD